GLTIPTKDLLKSTSKFDINIFKSNSPLLCVYKKGNCKLDYENNVFSLNYKKFKKEFNIFSNSLMTLSILEMAEYYAKFKDIDLEKYNLGILYKSLARKQLEFYAANLRTPDGVFTDKVDSSDELFDETRLENKNEKFRFSDHILMMAAYYKYSIMLKDSISESYRVFSNDIFNMLLNFKEEMYTVSTDELSKICLGLNIYFSYCTDIENKALILDVMDLLLTRYNPLVLDSKNMECDLLTYINCKLFYENFGIMKFDNFANELASKILSIYDDEHNIFIKNHDKSDVEYYCSEIVLYILSLCLYFSGEEDEANGDNLIVDVYKNMVINSGLAPSWPEAPTVSMAERYLNFSLNSKDLLDESNYRMANIATPESAEAAPILLKSIIYNFKKQIFKQDKFTFDTNKYLLCIFMILFCLKPNEKIQKGNEQLTETT
ncbi:MAG: hypothetical protein K0R54_4817, partial [Clostridiaceae bacterium]|nr:hypothetical protein [Clostridiaceae bacterium]